MRTALAFFVLILIAGSFLLGEVAFLIGSAKKRGKVMNDKTEVSASEVNDVNELSITVVYDNNPYKEGLETDWGFSAVITGTEKTILFDTGGTGSMLLDNMAKLAVEPNSIDVVVLSHIHGDHTGGLDEFLKKNSNLTVYVPKAFPQRFKNNVSQTGARLMEVDKPCEICRNVYSVGQLGTLIKEQALTIRTDKGLVVITGCAHPGIVKMVESAKTLLKNDILFVMGGFHLEWSFAAKIKKVISQFERLGVRYAGPCHCSGRRCRAQFEKHFGSKYIKIGAGKIIKLDDLK